MTDEQCLNDPCPADRAMDRPRMKDEAVRKERRVEWAQIAAMAVVVALALWIAGALVK